MDQPPRPHQGLYWESTIGDPDDGLYWESVASDPGLVDVLTRWEQDLTAPPSPVLRSLHIASAASAAEAASTPPRGVLTAGRSLWMRRAAFLSSLTSGLVFKVAVGAVAMATAGGGVAAAAGVLPDPVQAATADALDVIGVHIPHPDEAGELEDENDGVEQGPASDNANPNSEDKADNSGDKADNANPNSEDKAGNADDKAGNANPNSGDKGDNANPNSEDKAGNAGGNGQGSGSGNAGGNGQGSGSGNAGGNGQGSGSGNAGGNGKGGG